MSDFYFVLFLIAFAPVVALGAVCAFLRSAFYAGWSAADIIMEYITR